MKINKQIFRRILSAAVIAGGMTALTGCGTDIPQNSAPAPASPIYENGPESISSYKVSGSKVTFSGPENMSCSVASDKESECTCSGNNKTVSFKEDGNYVVSCDIEKEEIINEGDNHFHYFPTTVSEYLVTKNGTKVDVKYLGTRGGRCDEDIERGKQQIRDSSGDGEPVCFSVFGESSGFSGTSLSVMNEYLPDTYIVYSYYDSGSTAYLCINRPAGAEDFSISFSNEEQGADAEKVSTLSKPIDGEPLDAYVAMFLPDENDKQTITVSDGRVFTFCDDNGFAKLIEQV